MSEEDDVEKTKLEEATEWLEFVQQYDANSLVRANDLGKYAFRDAVEPAQRVIDLFKILSADHLDFFPEQQLESVRSTAEAFNNLLVQFDDFDVETASPSVTEAQASLIQQLEAQHQSVFNKLQPLISFATVRSQDFTALTQDARKAVDQIDKDASKLMKALDASKTSAENSSREIRELAAEQGVSKQAIHFKTEADTHHNLAKDWLKYTIVSAIGLGVYSIVSLFIHNIPGTMSGTYGAFQLAVSKALIFAVIAYMVFLCSRNFLSHKHNEIVNRHRQNALATFTALADATSNAASSDVVLNHAAACIFGPQDTGYTKSNGGQSEKMPGLQIIPRLSEGVS